MFSWVFRAMWRIVVGLTATYLAYCTWFLFFPYLNRHLPIFFVLLILYLFIAYFGIPLLVRLWQVVFRPNHIPLYAASGYGWSSDPVNIAIVTKNRHQLVKIMRASGWHTADKSTLMRNIKLGYCILFKKPYPTAPFSKLYLFGRHQDIGFQIQTGSPVTPRHRHHVRFWQLDQHSKDIHSHTTFWQDILQLFVKRKKIIWIGTATHDIAPLAIRVQNLQITHKIDQYTNKERDYVVRTLKQAGHVTRHDIISAGDPITFRGQTFGVNIVTDGTLHILEIH